MKISLNFFRQKVEPVIVVFLLLLSTGVEAPGPLKQLTTLLLYTLVPLLALSQWKKIAYAFTKNIPLLLLTLLAMLSILWSTVPNVSGILARALLVRTLFAAYLGTRYSPKELLKLLLWTFGMAVCLSFVFNGNNGGDKTGIFAQKNEFARVMAVAALLFTNFTISDPKHRYRYLLLLALSILLLLISKGKSSLVVFLLSSSLLPLYWFIKQNYKLQVVLGIFSGIIVVATVIASIVNFEFIVVDLLQKPIDLNGRTPIWTYFIERGMEKAWLGYGYGAFFNDPNERVGIALYTWYGSGITSVGDVARAPGLSNAHAHSGILDLFLSLGFVGLIFFGITTAVLFFRLLRLLGATRSLEALWMLQFLTFMVALNSTITGTILHQKHLFWLLFIAISISSGIQIDRLNRSRYMRLDSAALPEENSAAPIT